MLREQGDMTKDRPDQTARRIRVFERNMVGNGVEIARRGLRPDYFSHRAMRFSAWA